MNTPINKITSSVFLTPPSSLYKNSQEITTTAPLSPPPVFSLLTPTKAVSTTEVVDFISLLYPSFRHISDQILSSLDPVDLTNCLSICKNWRQAVISNKNCAQKIRTSRKLIKKDSETIHHIKSTLQTLPQPHRAFGTTSINVITTSTVSMESLKVTYNTITANSITNLRSCSKCSSPARKINVHNVHCNFCDYNFCCQCFKSSHKQSCTRPLSLKRPVTQKLNRGKVWTPGLILVTPKPDPHCQNRSLYSHVLSRGCYK